MKLIHSNHDLIQDVLAMCICPVCHGNLKIKNEYITCNECERIFPIINGIPDFISDVHKPEKIQELSDIYENANSKYPGSPKSCGYSGNTDYLSRLNVLKQWIDFKKVRGEKIVDIGCGIGLMTAGLVEKNEVWGVDISSGLLNMARKKGLKAILASGHLLPFKEDHFDIAICIGVIPYYKDPSRIFSEICRVTRPEGKMVITSTANSLLIRSIRFLKNFLGLSSQLAHLYTAREIEKYVMPRGGKILDSCTCYSDNIYPFHDDRYPVRFKLFSRTNAVLAKKAASDE
jgi:ubiquinone/menaquinone biosynthesis C-methylase UbiE